MRLTLDAVVSELRAIALHQPDGELIGSEDAVVARLGASRATVRQAARLLEKEGLLIVRRGFSGGYFAARPGLATVENIASSYLQAIDVNPRHIAMIALVLWVEVVREAAQLHTPEAHAVAQEWMDRIAQVAPDADFHAVVELEQEFRAAIFALIDARYVELIFHINATLGMRQAFGAAASAESSAPRPSFVKKWRAAKLAELQAIIDGDCELAALAARHSSNVLQRQYDITEI